MGGVYGGMKGEGEERGKGMGNEEVREAGETRENVKGSGRQGKR